MYFRCYAPLLMFQLLMSVCFCYPKCWRSGSNRHGLCGQTDKLGGYQSRCVFHFRHASRQKEPGNGRKTVPGLGSEEHLIHGGGRCTMRTAMPWGRFKYIEPSLLAAQALTSSLFGDGEMQAA